MGLSDALKRIVKGDSKKGGGREGGIIGYLGLSNWFKDLPKNYRAKLLKYGSMGIGTTRESLVSGKGYTSQNQQGFLSTVGYNAVYEKDYKFAELVGSVGFTGDIDRLSDTGDELL